MVMAFYTIAKVVDSSRGSLLLLLLCLVASAYGQIGFGNSDGFRLTTSQHFFKPNDNVTLTCTRAANHNSDNGPRSLVFPNTKGITWERNGQSLFSTLSKDGACRVQAEVLLGRPAVTQRELEAVTCTEDDVSVSVTIRNVTISSAGDRWICSKFPFMESNAVSLHNFAPLTDVTLTVQDHYPDDVNTGVLMTLVCRASPCNPPPSVTWRLERDGHALSVPERSRTRTQVDSYGRVVLSTELALAADPRYENATVLCRGSNSSPMGGDSSGIGGGGGSASGSAGGDAAVWITSEMVRLTVKRPPRILLTVNPSNEVTEGTVVTLTCGAHGHPGPEVRWRKEGGFLPGGLMEADTPIVRLNPARVPDQGQYVCKAFNGVAPDAENSVYLKVNEPIRTLKISDENRSTEITEKEAMDTNISDKTAMTRNSNNDDNNNKQQQQQQQ